MTVLRTFRNALGSPSYEDDDVLLYHGDAFTLLERMPSACIPLTVTSPPYNIGKEYEVVKGTKEYVEWTSKERTIHPAQFPIELLSRIILASSTPGDIILDPFAGSGSSLEAAIRTGRKAIGFELNIDYIKVAATRMRRFRQELATAGAQTSFFDSETTFDRNEFQTR
jgi:DNA modification methylase